jgi:aryl-alcohol dehydrogenase-like predicted oxidoreductase
MRSRLPTRPLDSSGLDITPVGFGAWAIGGGGWSFGWGPQDDTASLAAMRRALELGVNWIDTAAVYGLGHSEERSAGYCGSCHQTSDLLSSPRVGDPRSGG